MSFEGEARQFAENAQARMTRIVRASALKLFTNIIERTPVDTGRARANWQIDLNDISENAGVNFQGERGASDDEARRGRNAAQAASEATGKAMARIGDIDERTLKIFIFNNVNYIIPLEYGSSEQAPDGMVRISLAEWQQIVAAMSGGSRA